ncbi:cytochrome c oxidase, subunit VIb [Lipomyces doorenjongii]
MALDHSKIAADALKESLEQAKSKGLVEDEDVYDKVSGHLDSWTKAHEDSSLKSTTGAISFPGSPTRYDPRFPNQNQTAHCWQSYVDYFKCINAKGEGFKPCQQFRRGYLLLCPQSWVEKWDEQREAGNFVGDLSP